MCLFFSVLTVCNHIVSFPLGQGIRTDATAVDVLIFWVEITILCVCLKNMFMCFTRGNHTILTTKYEQCEEKSPPISRTIYDQSCSLNVLFHQDIQENTISGIYTYGFVVLISIFGYQKFET